MHKILSFFLLILICISTKSQPQDTIVWRADYKLKMEDFRGVSDSNSKFKAVSYPSIYYTFSATPAGFSYKVICSFNKTKSWIKTNDKFLLSHEQGHFNITELFARKLIQAFKNYKFNYKTIESDLDNIYESIQQECKKMNDIYDKETNFSINKTKQAYWEKKIITELNKNNRKIFRD